MSPIRTKLEAKSWLEIRLAQEGPGLWTDRERKDLSDQVAEAYRPASGGPQWSVKRWTEGPNGNPVYVVTRGGVVGIHTVPDRDKADAIMRALNALDAEMRPPAKPAQP
jgi:hypothetical protein